PGIWFFEIRLFGINSPALIFCFSDNAITLKFRHSRAGGNLDLSARKLIGKKGFFRFYSGLTKTSTALPRLSSKRTIL
ncbi:hypothetical protein, partial [Neisseria meningitidis]